MTTAGRSLRSLGAFSLLAAALGAASCANQPDHAASDAGAGIGAEPVSIASEPASAADLEGIPETMPGPPGQPVIKLTLEQRTEMARRDRAERQMDEASTNQKAETRLIDNLTAQQMAAIAAVVTPGPGGAPAAAPQMSPARRDRLELSFDSGRLARDGLYLADSVVPEGKAVEAFLSFRWNGGNVGGESWPAMFLPGIQPPPDSNHEGAEPRLNFEMRANARADGTMEFALLSSINGQEMLFSGIDVKSGGIGVIDLPGGHSFAIHATLRDQTASQKEAVRRMAAARAQGPEAVTDFKTDMLALLYSGEADAQQDLIPPEVLQRMRASRRNEAAAYALGARPD